MSPTSKVYLSSDISTPRCITCLWLLTSPRAEKLLNHVSPTNERVSRGQESHSHPPARKISTPLEQGTSQTGLRSAPTEYQHHLGKQGPSLCVMKGQEMPCEERDHFRDARQGTRRRRSGSFRSYLLGCPRGWPENASMDGARHGFVGSRAPLSSIVHRDCGC